MSKIKTYTFLCALFAIPLTALAPSTLAYDASGLTVQTNCPTSSTANFTAVLDVPHDEYNVYARLAKKGQSANITAYASLLAGCNRIGTVTANGDSWTLAGRLIVPSDEGVILQLSSDTLSNTIDANRPSLMLVSATNPTCTPSTECVVGVGATTGIVEPPGTLNSEDSLHAVRVVDPSKDTVTKVVYYVDEQPVYTTKTLQPFDFRYVSSTYQKLNAAIQYKSGERVIITLTAPDDFQDSIINFLFRLYQSNPKIFLGGAVLFGSLLLAFIILGIIHAIYRRHLWLLNHGLIKTKITRRPIDSSKVLNTLRIRQRVKLVSFGVLYVSLLVVLIGGANTYIFTLFKVNGVSMESTYANGSEMFVNKIPVTLARLAGHDYVPKRGEVVIIREVYGIVDPSIAKNTSEYLIKRVIGLPGERVIVKDGTVSVMTIKGETTHPDQDSKWAKTMHANDTSENIDLTLSNNEIFVSGDNRPASIDSRFNGPITTDNVVGIVTFRLW